MKIMSVVRLLAAAVGASLSVVAGVAGVGVAHADPPSPGDPCSQYGASTQDGSGQTMWCHHSQSGHSLAWQYSDASNEHG